MPQARFLLPSPGRSLARPIHRAARLLAAGLLLLGLAAPPARALDIADGAAEAPPAPPRSWAEMQAAECTAAIAAAERKYQILPKLMGTIAKVESGRPINGMADVRAWPWTINADGDGYFLESKPAAVAWVKQALARGVRFTDIGCMQVNLQMHPRAFASVEDAFDPALNADYAARYLRQLLSEAGGNWSVAVGLYHSHTPDLAEEYRAKVAQVGAGIITGIGGPEPLFRTALRRGTLRLAMAGGGVLVLRLDRQPARVRQHKSACQIAALLGDFAPAPIKGCAGARR